jgi:hypothetical protein
MELYFSTTGYYYILDDSEESSNSNLKIIPDFTANNLTITKYIFFENKKYPNKITSKIKFEDIQILSLNSTNKLISKIKLENIMQNQKISSNKNIDKVTIIELINSENGEYDISCFGKDEKDTNYLYYYYNSNEFKKIDEIIWEIITLKVKKQDIKFKDVFDIIYSWYRINKNDEEYKNLGIFSEYNEELTRMNTYYRHIIKIPITDRKVDYYYGENKNKECENKNKEYAMYNHITNKWSIIDKNTYDKLRDFGKDLDVSGINKV